MFICMNSITLPETLDQAVENLNSLGELVFATDWKRAAIVRAFCEKSKPGPKGDRSESPPISISAFCRLGIVGLRDKATVLRYYDAWDLTSLPEPKPGQAIALPGIEFPSIERRPQIEPPPSRELEPYEPDDDEIIDGEIVDDELPNPPSPMSKSEAAKLLRDYEDSIPEAQKTWNSLRKANQFLIEVRNALRSGVTLDGPLSSGTVENYLILTAEISPQLEGMI